MLKNRFFPIAIAVTMVTCVGMQACASDPSNSPLESGLAAPDFTLTSQTDTPVSLHDYRGKYVVVYFYPKDRSTGCTMEAHNFQRDAQKYAAANAVVLGISLDSVESHKSFCSKDGINFKLLADPDHKAIDRYRVPILGFGPLKFASRDTFLISPQGRITKVWKVKSISNHSEEVLRAIAADGH